MTLVRESCGADSWREQVEELAFAVGGFVCNAFDEGRCVARTLELDLPMRVRSRFGRAEKRTPLVDQLQRVVRIDRLSQHE